MFNTLPTSSDDLIGKSWDAIQPYFDELEARDLTAETLDQWLRDYSRLEDWLSEYGARRQVAASQDTSDAEAERLLSDYFEKIMPGWDAADQRMREKLLASGLEPAGLAIALRNLRSEVDLFRAENLPLMTEEEQLKIRFNKIMGAQSVTWDGEEKTLRQMEPLLLDDDRAVRERAWKATSQRQLADRDALNDAVGGTLDGSAEDRGERGQGELRRVRMARSQALRLHDRG